MFAYFLQEMEFSENCAQVDINIDKKLRYSTGFFAKPQVGSFFPITYVSPILKYYVIFQFSQENCQFH